MASETGHVIAIDHFEGQANLTKGSSKSLSNKRSGQTLAQILRLRRKGRYTAGGIGDEVITFDEPFEDENFTVSVTGDATSAPVLKAAPTAGTGFTITAAGAGPVHWIAEHDGPAE